MKILHMHTKMVSGGIEAMVSGLVNELIKTNSVTLCTIFKPGPDDIFLNRISSGVKLDTIGKKNYGFSIKEIFKIYQYIKKGDFDIVHIHGCFQYYFLAILLLRRKNRFVYTIHSDAKMENQRWDKRLFFLKKLCFRKYVSPVTISDSSQHSFSDLYKCSNTLIYNGIKEPPKCSIDKISQYRISTGTRVFINPGRISKAKNQLVLCRVFQRLINEGNDVVLLIAGLKEDLSIYDVIKPYFSNRIIYLGERNDITDLMQYCDGFCLPSIWEGLPITLLEAFATGCVPICSPVGGIKDVVVHGSNGFLSQSSAEVHYYDVMKQFLKISCEEYSNIKKRCVTTFGNYSIKNTAQEYNNLYLSLMKNQ